MSFQPEWLCAPWITSEACAFISGPISSSSIPSPPPPVAASEAARELLGFPAPVAARFKLTLLIIHHLRKPRRTSWRTSPPPTADDLRGTSHISAVARAILTLSLAVTASAQRDPNGPRRLELVKTSLSEYPPPCSSSGTAKLRACAALYLRFESGPHGVPTINYSDALEPPNPPTKGEGRAQWILDHLRPPGGRPPL